MAWFRQLTMDRQIPGQYSIDSRCLMTEHLPEAHATLSSAEHSLACPLCQFRFSYRDYAGAARTCPSCKVPLGLPLYYRIILIVAYLAVAAFVVYKGYDGIGGFLVSLPFAAIFGLASQVAILRTFPPSLQPYADGGTWLKLNHLKP